MRIRFIGQPFDGAGQIGRVITDALAAEGASHLWVATAWGKQSGLARITQSTADFHAAAGPLRSSLALTKVARHARACCFALMRSARSLSSTIRERVRSTPDLRG